jgi:hypothetical protein
MNGLYRSVMCIYEANAEDPLSSSFPDVIMESLYTTVRN